MPLEESFFQPIFNIPVALYRFEIAVDGTHQLQYVSARFFELFEIPVTTALTDVASLFDRILIEDRPGFHRSRMDFTASEQRWNWEGRWIMPSGKVEWMRAESRQTCLPDSSIVWDGILINISDRKQVEEKLYLTNQELIVATQRKDEFIARISHEVRTPLNTILGMSDILKEEIFGVLDRQQLESLLTIDRSGEQLLSLMNDILDISNISQGKLELNFTNVAVLALCNSSLTFFTQQALDKQIQLNLQVSPGIDNIEVDERRIQQILTELLSNAVKFTPTGGSVILSVTRQEQNNDSWIDFAITDTGIGISSDDLDTIFQPFVQIDRKLNRQYVGAGLGLSLAQQLVELHGGRIILKSEIGCGSCFTMRLPEIGLTMNREFVPFNRRIGDDINEQFFN
jgi:signal transduction histidine kinase